MSDDKELNLDDCLEQYLSDKKAGVFKRPTCGECGGGTSHLFHPHKDTCSKFEHFVDDHYDSPCMRGTCKYCFPNYKTKKTIQVSEEEYNDILEMRKKQ